MLKACLFNYVALNFFSKKRGLFVFSIPNRLTIFIYRNFYWKLFLPSQNKRKEKSSKFSSEMTQNKNFFRLRAYSVQNVLQNNIISILNKNFFRSNKFSLRQHVFDKNLHNGNAYLKSFKEIKHKLFSNFTYYSLEHLVQHKIYQVLIIYLIQNQIMEKAKNINGLVAEIFWN